jgi:chloride channel 3/4/5
MVAVSILQILNPLRTGRLVMFGLTIISDWHDFELIPFAIIGIFGGLFGALFIKWNIKMASLRKTTSLKNHPIVEIFLLCLLTSLISYGNDLMR